MTGHATLSMTGRKRSKVLREPSLKAGIWVSAQVRQCSIQSIGIYVRHKGDPDAGSIVLKLDRLDGTSVMLSQSRDGTGARTWLAPLGMAAVANPAAEEYLERRIARDPDIWILEIEDPAGKYLPDAPIVE